MNKIIQEMLSTYACKSLDDYRFALKEIIQLIALSGLSRGNFFATAAFYGGTALRTFYGLRRFSEDLDFTLLVPDTDFNITDYFGFIEDELSSYGFAVEISRKEKAVISQVESAFIKANTLVRMINVVAMSSPVAGVAKNEILKIKLEIDTLPPPLATTEIKYQLQPTPFALRLYDLPSLFAGKLHAVLCRGWGSGRVKGRDLYDYVWYLSQGISVNLPHLEARMRQSGHWQNENTLDISHLRQLLLDKFSQIDYPKAILDVRPFILDQEYLSLWNNDFFLAITMDKLK